MISYERVSDIVRKIVSIKKVFSNYMVFIWGYLGYNSKNYILETRNGLKVYIEKNQQDISDIDIAKEVFVDNEYGKIEPIIKDDMTIIDIGANIGCFAIKYSKLVQNGHIYCFEPIRQNFARLKRNIVLNKFKNISLYNEAISSKKGYIDIFLSTDNIGGHSMFGSSKCGIEKVKSTTLEDVIQKNNIKVVDILKIDCEGAEYEILLSCSETVLSKVHYIIMEQHITDETKLKYSENDIIEYLRKNGFDVEIIKEIFYEGEGLFYIIYAKNKKVIL